MEPLQTGEAVPRPGNCLAQSTHEQSQQKEKLMKKIGRGLVAAAAICTLVVGLAGCKKEGPGERVGKELDKAGDTVKDAVQDLKK